MNRRILFSLFFFIKLNFVNCCVLFGDNECDPFKFYLKYDIPTHSNLTRSIFSNFNSFSDLYAFSNCCNFTFNITNFVTFIPNSANTILDEQFSLKRFIAPLELNNIAFLQFFNIKAIDIHLKPFRTVFKHLNVKLNMEIYSSHLDFYSNGSSLCNECCSTNFYSNDTEVNLFNSFYNINFVTTVYPRKWCPFVFKNSRIARLIFADITNSFLRQNRLRFLDINETNSNLEMHLLEQITFNLQYEILDRGMLNVNLFRRVKMIRVNGVLNGIEEDLFKSFKFLKNIDFQINNFKEFFHAGTKWMSHLNSGFNINLNKRPMFLIRFLYRKEMVSFDPIYVYPDEDLCLFAQFPHDRFIFPILVPGMMLNCTCTLKWLESLSDKFKKIISISNDYSTFYESQFVTTEVNSFLFCVNDTRDCQFETKFNQCQIEITLNRDSVLQVIMIFFLFKDLIISTQYPF